MALDDKRLYYIPSTRLSIETVHEAKSVFITVGENPEVRHTIPLKSSPEVEKYVSTLKKGDKIIVSEHEGNFFIYGPIEEEKLYKRAY